MRVALAQTTARKSVLLEPIRRCAAAGSLALFLLHYIPQATLPAFAQELDQKQASTVSELETVRQQIELTEKQRQDLADEIGRLEKDRKTINKDLIETSKRARDLETRISRSGDRLGELQQRQSDVKTSLKGRRALLGEVIGALERMGRNPPPAILVTPDDALTSVRSAIMLGAVVPELRAETEILATELAELNRIRSEIDNERATLTASLQALAGDEERLNLLLQEKKNRTNSARQQLAAETARSAELAAKAGSLQKLIESLESEIAAARDAAEKARLAEEARLAKENERLANAREESPKPDFSDTGRIAPAIAFDEAQGLLPRPVSGVEIRSFGQKDRLGEISNGISIATRVSARVSAPSDGWVVYAGPFRSYGQLLILNAGSGYHVVLAGMERIDVQTGQFVLAGEPVAAMGARRLASTGLVDVESSRPVLYVEFRKDGKSIDPSQWWADNTLKREPDDS